MNCRGCTHYFIEKGFCLHFQKFVDMFSFCDSHGDAEIITLAEFDIDSEFYDSEFDGLEQEI